jgi:hypothetical protein
LTSSAGNRTSSNAATMSMAGHMHNGSPTSMVSHHGPMLSGSGPVPAAASSLAPVVNTSSMQNVSSSNPEVCNPWQHVVTVCKLDEGMGRMSGERRQRASKPSRGSVLFEAHT